MAKYVFFYLDAVGEKFLKYMPYLSNMGNKGCKSNVEVEPLHQMEFAIFNSQKQKHINHWTWYYFNPHKSLYKWTKYLPKFCDNIRIKKMINYINVLKEYLKGNSHFVPIGDIPLEKLKCFDLTSKKSFIDKNPIKEIPSFFDILRKNNISYYAYEWPVYSNENKTGMKIIKKDDYCFLNQILKHLDKDFLFVHLTVFDALLHEKGSKDKNIKQYLINLDKHIKKTCEILIKENKDITIIACSDHSMVDVTKKINISDLFDNINVVYFTDSTCIRVWAKNKEDVDKIKSRLKSKNGKIYTKDNADKCPVRFKREYSGDLLFVANPGYQICPNFFNGYEMIKAMHGYDKTKQLDAFFISNKKMTKRKRISVIDICPAVLKYMNVKIPEKWDGNPD